MEFEEDEFIDLMGVGVPLLLYCLVAAAPEAAVGHMGGTPRYRAPIAYEQHNR